MADFSDSSRGATTPGPGSRFRPYAEGSGKNAGLYEELKNPLESLRNATDGQFTSGVGVGRLPPGMALEDIDALDLEYAEQLDTAQAATELAKFAGYRYLATLASSPFSVAQTLLQVQYQPLAVHGTLEQAQEVEDEAPDPDDPAYYEYLRARHSGRAVQAQRGARVTVDHSGYAVAGRSGYEMEALPQQKLTVLRRLVGHPTEGVLSMFKGALTQWTYDMLHLVLQPTVEGVLNEALGLYDSAPMGAYIDSTAPSALTLVASSLLVGWLLSPLELARTRLVVQSASPIHRKYRGLWHALRTIAREEGGLRALYFSPLHAVPTLVKHTLDPIFRNMGSFAIDRVAAVDPYDHPTTFALAGLMWKTLSAVVMLPIDTVRARLQAQPRYSAKPVKASAPLEKSGRAGPEQFREFRTCVALSPVPYTGMANCAWRIITEEGESLEKMKRRATSEAPGPAHYGLRGLYPGLSLQLVASVAIFGLNLLGTDDVEVVV